MFLRRSARIFNVMFSRACQRPGRGLLRDYSWQIAPSLPSAGLSMRAEPDGDEWVVNGQKVWTTLAHASKWGMLVTRTNPESPKHRGLTYFVVDMEADGIDVRPLYQITGEAEFSEVFFNDVEVPVSSRSARRLRPSIGPSSMASIDGTTSSVSTAESASPPTTTEPSPR